ncbi:hypothetical protein [Bacillus sp. FJAT-50079]|uniref:hypothetical protein n=1 Tax=Bacillus sp. FJAT-50079 TaxID=2833577 RepID=UPI001BC947B9|nr:hypothetical protein [Bacillus sp. FJAT-50079]MBS4208672.1 hypothetical protein [Bacillus sp. FJAT-50079]
MKTQILHNGIELTKEWPPRYEEPKERIEMPVPYLKTKPEVIPINVGRQLFVDEFLIAETNLRSVYHKPEFHINNPVLKQDQEWEKTVEGYSYAAPFSDGIWYDEEDQKFKMWYLTGAGTINQSRHSLCTCYAESTDGVVWNKIVQDVVAGTNIVDKSNRDSSTVWLDKFEKDPTKRFKFFNVEYKADEIHYQFVLKYSSDGIHWSEGVAQSGSISDRCTAFFNPFTNKWVLSMRHQVSSVSNRSRMYLEHQDPEEAVSLAHRLREGTKDKHIVVWFTPDNKEKRHPKYSEVDPGIYNFDAIAYESIMLGFYSQWQGPDNKICKELVIPKRNEIQLGYSRDGFHFARPTHESFMEVNETDDAWNWGNMQSINGVPLVVGDYLYFYSSGRSCNKVWWDAGVSTGLAKLRRDGFVSMHADDIGFLTTEKVIFDGKYLFVNANVQKSLAVELIDEYGTVIEGYRKEDCNAININSTKQMITWKNKSNVVSLVGKPIQLKFYLNSADLYAFWISPWETGESRGYTGGGGPGLSSSGMDIPYDNGKIQKY